MSQDHYATLGVTPTAKAAVIRAAYLALLRQYHPDRNSSPAAVERAQTIIAAFKVLGDFDRRNQYDWDQRRAREAAAAIAPAAKRLGRIGAWAVTAGAIGLAAVGASFLRPAAGPEPRPISPSVTAAPTKQAPLAKVRPVARSSRVATASPFAEPKRVAAPSPAKAKTARPVPVAPRIEPARIAKTELERPMPNTTGPAAVAARSVATAAPDPVPKAVPVSIAPRQAKATAKPVPPAARPETDLVSLDQFVMSYYGQSWRVGDPPKRAVLEQTRASFVARRGACSADPCKRAAYLKLMREISQIVEHGQPSAR